LTGYVDFSPGSGEPKMVFLLKEDVLCPELEHAEPEMLNGQG
jgi:hypothetical protein